MLKTFVLDTFADENTIKPMDFQFSMFFNSLTEVYFLGFSWGIKEESPRNTHKACLGQRCRPARDREGPFKKCLKNKGLAKNKSSLHEAKNLQR